MDDIKNALTSSMPFAVLSGVVFFVLAKNDWTTSFLPLVSLPGIMCVGIFKFGYGVSSELRWVCIALNFIFYFLFFYISAALVKWLRRSPERL